MIVQIFKNDEKEIKRIVEIYNSYFECFEFKISEEFLNFSLMDKNFYLFAFKDNNEICGFCGIYFYNSEICEIGPIAVDKKFLNKGISTSLLNFVLSFAKHLNIKECFVRVKKENLKAVNLFSKFLFNLESQHDDIIIMNRKL